MEKPVVNAEIIGRGKPGAQRLDELRADHPALVVRDDQAMMKQAYHDYAAAYPRREIDREALSDQAELGQLMYFPWLDLVTRYPSPDVLFAQRTSRNRNLITEAEAEILYHKSIGIFGLSVGSNINAQLVRAGIGNRFALGDPDTVDFTSLNRAEYTPLDVGEVKHIATARKNSIADPYAEQYIFEKGFSNDPATLTRLGEFGLNLFVEEMDDVRAKARSRRFCAQQRIPLIMATDLGERIAVDVERHDLEVVEPFNGKISWEQFDRLTSDGELSEMDVQRAQTRIAGARHILKSERMVRSLLDAKRDQTVGGIPQLGATATAAAAISMFAAREILLGHRLDSGTYAFDARQVLRLQRDSPLAKHASTLREFATYLRRK